MVFLETKFLLQKETDGDRGWWCNVRVEGRVATQESVNDKEDTVHGRRQSGQQRKRWINKRGLIDEVVDHCYRHHKRRSTIDYNDGERELVPPFGREDLPLVRLTGQLLIVRRSPV